MKKRNLVILAMAGLLAAYDIQPITRPFSEADGKTVVFAYDDITTDEYTFNTDTGIISKYTGESSEVTIPDEIHGITVTGIGNGAFQNCTFIKKVSIPDSVTIIGNNSFSGCSSLTGIALPPGLTYINRSVFMNCSALKEIYIPCKITEIQDAAFLGCTSLEKITFESFTDKNNNKTTSLESIGLDAFLNCKSLKVLSIPDSVKEIGENAFYCCNSLDTIYYTGTEKQWKEININKKNNDVLDTANIVFMGDLSQDSNIPENEETTVTTVTAVSETTGSSVTTSGTSAVTTATTKKDAPVTSTTTFKKLASFSIAAIKDSYLHDSPINFIYGDLNDDGDADLTDLTLMSVYLMNGNIHSYQLAAADVDGSGAFDIADLPTFKQYICKDKRVPYLGPKK